MNVQQLTEFAGGAEFVECTPRLGDLAATVIDMGYGADCGLLTARTALALAEFERETGADPHKLVGRHWALVGGRVFIAGQ